MTASSQSSNSAISPQSYRFLALYALAWAGGAVAYVPFLTILLPVRVTALTGADDISWLAYATFFGAVTASVSNIAFGWASDLTQTRRPWVLAGLSVTIIMFAVIAVVDDPVSLIGAILLWQVGLNMMLAPLAAWAGDRVPNAQKGILGGLTALAPAVGAVAGIIVTMPGLAGATGRLAVVATMVCALILPVVLAGGQSGTTVTGDDAGLSHKVVQVTLGRVMVVLWLARLAIQVAEAALFAYLLFYFRSLDPNFRDADVARIFGGVLIVTVPIALLSGRWMDRSHRPVLALLICAIIAAVGLALMAVAAQLGVALAGYIIFGMGSAVFLALHSGQTLRVLYHSERRGRSLGVFNLTNTIPSLIVPWLTLLIVPNFGFAPLIWLLATLSFAAALLLTTIVRQR
ncbi:MAG: MFS transporter [Chakrabartia sp.]